MKRFVWSMVLFIGTIAFLNSQDFTSWGLDLKSQSKEGPYTVYQFRAPGNIDLSVFFKGTEIRKSDQERLQGILSIFKGFTTLLPSSIRVILADERTEILLVPRSFRYKDRDLAIYMPSGIQFFYTDFLEFDFRIVVENLFLRIKGQFFKEEEFAEKILAAVLNPYAYIQSQDPEYILKRFQDIEARIDRLLNEGEQINSRFGKEVQEIRGLLGSLKQEVVQQVQTQQTLERKVGDLYAEFQLLRYALLVLNNRGFFGSIRLPSEAGINRLVELKKQQPKLTMDEAREKLKTEGIEMTSKEVFLVFSVYFNEFQ
ncbi:MAG: hypothetical protein N2442_02580 [Spirochaetes bacterium]|nr:hypothetical protein [Spirochaetota bacterium]